MFNIYYSHKTLFIPLCYFQRKMIFDIILFLFYIVNCGIPKISCSEARTGATQKGNFRWKMVLGICYWITYLLPWYDKKATFIVENIGDNTYSYNMTVSTQMYLIQFFKWNELFGRILFKNSKWWEGGQGNKNPHPHHNHSFSTIHTLFKLFVQKVCCITRITVYKRMARYHFCSVLIYIFTFIYSMSDFFNV